MKKLGIECVCVCVCGLKTVEDGCFVSFSMEGLIGSCQDSFSLDAALASHRRPTPELITYDGVFNESYIRNSKTSELLDVILHAGKGPNQEIYLGLEVISCLDGKPRPVSI
jgi:hypothetical protein